MDAIRDALARAHESVEDMVRLGSLMEDLECHVDNSPYFREDGSFAGRRGGIRRLLQEEAPDLYARYKTLMKYKALSKRFRQAVGVGDPIPASSVLPSAEAAVEAAEAGLSAALREAREVFRRSRELISDCECTVASLAAQLARRVDPDYAPRVAPETATGITTMIASIGGAGGASSGGTGGAARDAPGKSTRKRSSA